MKLETLFGALFLVTAFTGGVQDDPASTIPFSNVNVFDGTSEPLIEDANVVVTGNLIPEISTDDLAVVGGQVIDGGVNRNPFVMKDGVIFKDNLEE